MTRVAWLSPQGLAQHVVAGFVLTVVLGLLGTSPPAATVACFAMGLAHELGDGDLTTAAGHPWNGLVDVAFFLVAPIVWWVRS